LAVLDIIEGEGLVENARLVGDHLLSSLRSACCGSSATAVACSADNQPRITDLRGRGLMIGIELNVPYKEIRQRLLFNEHVFTGCAGTNVLRLLPPLCLSMAESDEFIEKFTKTILSPL
jgi:acetylornithine aminotransferase